jgi:predicted DCC family thiol-disulfide oxidoreductase YuxK
MTLSTALRRETPLFVFDGVCVLCSEGASFIMRHDPGGQVQFASAQSDLGRAIYEKMGLPIDSSYLLVDSAGTHAKTDGYFQLARILGGWFRLGLVFRIVPRPVRDWFYDRVAKNRYRWFGQAGYCELLEPDQRARLVESDESFSEPLLTPER